MEGGFILRYPLSEKKGIPKLITLLVSYLLFSSFITVVKATEIVVNKSVPVHQSSLNKIRTIFTMRQQFWPNGEKIKVFTLVDHHPIHQTFTKTNLNMFPHQLRRVWDRIVFSGTGQVPVQLSNEEEMLDKIANTPNAIGYLSSEPENENIRIFKSK